MLKTYGEAKQSCKQLEGHLVTIDDPGIQIFIENVISNSGRRSLKCTMLCLSCINTVLVSSYVYIYESRFKRCRIKRVNKTQRRSSPKRQGIRGTHFSAA